MMNLHEEFGRFLSKGPTLGKDVFIAQGAVVVGDVSIGDYSSIWFNAVLRGDINKIIVGRCTNIQDNCVLHLSDSMNCQLGNYVTVGHGAIVHGCTVEDEALVGMNATVLDGAVVGRNSLVGANSLVPLGMRIPPGTLVLGAPARIVRDLTAEEKNLIKSYAEKYVRAAGYYMNNRIAPIAPSVKEVL